MRTRTGLKRTMWAVRGEELERIAWEASQCSVLGTSCGFAIENQRDVFRITWSSGCVSN